MMKFTDLLSISAQTWQSNRLRTVLTLLGITIGIAALTATLSIMQGTNEVVDKILAGFGGKFMEVEPNWDPILRRMEAGNFTIYDVRAISKVSGITLISLRKAGWWIPVKYQNRDMQTDIYGTDTNFLTIRNRKVEKGRFIEEQDLLNRRRVCVITQGIKNRFFPAGDYLDQKMEINGSIFMIVGCLEPILIPTMMGGPNRTEEGTIFIPITACQSLFNQYDCDQILLTYAKEYEPKSKIMELKGRIENILQFRNGAKKVYRLTTLDEFAQRQVNLAFTITVALCSVAGLCLLVGGIGNHEYYDG